MDVQPREPIPTTPYLQRQPPDLQRQIEELERRLVQLSEVPTHPHPGAPGPDGALPDLRRQIEELDHRLLDLIAARCRLARAAGERKRAAELPIADPGQEAIVVRRAAERAREAELDVEGVRHLFWCLIGLSRRAQELRTGDGRDDRA